MRVLIFDSYYPEFTKGLYELFPDLAHKPYQQQLQTLYDTGFARSDSLARNFRALGHEAEQIIVNIRPLQDAWAVEHGIPPVGRAPQALFASLSTRLFRLF